MTKTDKTSKIFEFKFSNVLYIPIISSRNKETGEYQLDMDGNVNSMLHKLYIQRKHIQQLTICIPERKYFSDKALAKYDTYIKFLFPTFRIIFQRIDLYKENVELTRNNIFSFKQTLNNSTEGLHIIAELPLEFSETIHSKNFITYNFNWSLSGEYQKTETLINSDILENKLAAKGYDITILSECQSLLRNDRKNVRIIKEIFSAEFVRKQFVSWKAIYLRQIDESILSSLFSLLNIEENFNDSAYSNIVFFPFRVDDDRYKFSEVVNACKQYKGRTLLLISNPTRVSIKIDLSLLPRNFDIIDLSTGYKSSENYLSRAIYIELLSKIAKTDNSKINIIIPHYEVDMHLSFAEQFVMLRPINIVSHAISLESVANRIHEDINASKESDNEILKTFNEIIHNTSKSRKINEDVDAIHELGESLEDESNTTFAGILISLVNEKTSDKLKIFQKNTNPSNSDLTASNVSDELSTIVPKVMQNNIHDLLSSARASFDSNISAIIKSDTVNILQGLVKTIVEKEKYGNLYFTGVGKNRTVAEKTANSFRSLGFDAHSIDPIAALHGDMGMLKDNDLIIAISKSGETSELNIFLETIRNNRPKIELIGLQQKGLVASKYEARSTMAKIVKIIDLPRVDELGSNQLVPTMSTILMQTYLDIVAVKCAEMNGYTKNDFLKNHPGGLIGKSK